MPGTPLTPFGPPGGFQILFGVYGYFLPFILLATWTVLAFIDISAREDMGKGRAIMWIAAILLVPFVGAVAYHVVGGSRLALWLRWSIIGGGALAWLAVVMLGGAILSGGIH
jgi:hypothetical protein